MCLGDFLPMRTLCDACHKEFESHWRSILDMPETFRCGGGGVSLGL